jgi:hypothetical protein
MHCTATGHRAWGCRARLLLAGLILGCAEAANADHIFRDGFDPPVPGDSCRAPVALSSGSPQTGTTIGFMNDFDVTEPSACGSALSGGYTAPDVVYSLTVPAGATLTVTVTPAASWDVGLILLGNCAAGAASCLEASDQGNAGAAETVVYAVNGSSAETVFVVVDGWTESEAGSFTLTAQLTFGFGRVVP